MGRLRRILIYRLGSIGDAVVALPPLRLVARAFPDAERVVLTGCDANEKAAPMRRVLHGTGLVHGYIGYPVGLRDPRALWGLRREIRRLRPDLLIYLSEPRGRWRTLRDVVFFYLCGVPKLVGVPYTADLRNPKKLPDGAYEYEGARLLRCLSALGAVDVGSEENFALGLSEREREVARTTLLALPPHAPLVAASIGTKWDVNDWGDENWSALFTHLAERLSGWSLIMVGAASERERSDRLLRRWTGSALNLCGTLSVRESAAVLERARLFIGHDSGPMHLAGAVGTPCVAIFSSRNLPGVWFPRGPGCRVLYRDVPCQGCLLAACSKLQKMCITSITVRDVVHEVEQAIGWSRRAANGC